MTWLRSFAGKVASAVIDTAVKAVANALLLAVKTAVVACTVAGMTVAGYGAYAVVIEGTPARDVPGELVEAVRSIGANVQVLADCVNERCWR